MAGTAANGLSSIGGLIVDGRRVTRPFTNGFEAARALLGRQDVRGAICLMTEQDVLRLGLPLDRWDAIEWRKDASKLDAQDRSRLQRMLRASIAQAQEAAST